MGCQATKMRRVDNKQAEHLILIQFCTRYQDEAIAIADKLDHKYPDTFHYEFRKDALMTGRLDVSLYLSRQDAVGNCTAKVYSKSENNGRFASENFRPLLTNIDQCFKHQEKDQGSSDIE
eukprot:403376973